jgi:hypothetical protein
MYIIFIYDMICTVAQRLGSPEEEPRTGIPMRGRRVDINIIIIRRR